MGCSSTATAGAVAVVLASARAARRRTVEPLEERLFRLVNGSSDRWHAPVWAPMQCGSLAAVVVASGVNLRAGQPRRAMCIAATGGGVWAGIKAVKPLIGRGRPDRHLDDVSVRGRPQSGLGYPSGHAAVSSTLAHLVAPQLGPTGRLLVSAAAAATAAGRVYVGAHLPLDVVGGAAIGLLVGRSAVGLLNGRVPAGTAVAGSIGR